MRLIDSDDELYRIDKLLDAAQDDRLEALMYEDELDWMRAQYVDYVLGQAETGDRLERRALAWDEVKGS